MTSVPTRWPFTIHGIHVPGQAGQLPQTRPNHQFPLAEIVGGNSTRARLADVRCIPLTKAAGLHNAGLSRTKIAAVVQEMTEGHPEFPRLRDIRRSDHLWNGLRNYGYMDSGVGWRTNDAPLPSVLPLPNAPQIVNAIHGLWAWHEGRCTRPDEIGVENETAVQDEVQEQLIKPLQLLLQTRYPKNIRSHIWQHLPIFWNQLTQSVHISREVLHSVTQDASGHFPRWGRPTIATNLGRETHKSKSAGYSDYVLYFGTHKECIAALFEVKNFWAYTSKQMEALSEPDTSSEIFEEGPHIPPGSNRFLWDQNGVVEDVVKQVWGELVYYGSRFAAWTNGKHIIIFARTGHEQMTVTSHRSEDLEWHNWDDSDVLATLFGMCCAGIDMKLLGDHGLMNMLVGNTY